MTNKHNSELQDEIWDKLLSEPKEQRPSLEPRTLPVVSSSIIQAATYRPDRLTLSIVFHNSPKERYVYYSVPNEVILKFSETLKDDRSVGRFFHRNIKGKFSFVKETIS